MGKAERRKNYSKIRRKLKRSKKRKVKYEESTMSESDTSLFSESESNPFSDTESYFQSNSDVNSNTECNTFQDGRKTTSLLDANSRPPQESVCHPSSQEEMHPGDDQEWSPFLEQFLDIVKKDKLFLSFVEWQKLYRQKIRISNKLLALENTAKFQKR